jgi:hypothetical protein
LLSFNCLDFVYRHILLIHSRLARPVPTSSLSDCFSLHYPFLSFIIVSFISFPSLTIHLLLFPFGFSSICFCSMDSLLKLE